jgi:nucleotide-binding universal stress UspA family protein
MTHLSKLLIVAVDGSEDALRSVDYLSLIYGDKQSVEVQLLYILPSLPPILVADQNRQSKLRLLDIESKNVQMAERILAETKDILLRKGFKESQVKGAYHKKQIGIARDICNFAGDKAADVLIITRRGRSRLEAFLLGEISSKILEGVVQSKQVLVAVDSSENSLRAVKHAGFMLADTDCQVTLFHTKRHLRRFVPQEVIVAAPELEELWREKATEQIGPQMQKAKGMLLEAGLGEGQITTKLVDGSRSAAADILKEARSNGFGTIVLGRKGRSSVKEYLMGSTTSKVFQDSNGLAIWVVH